MISIDPQHALLAKPAIELASSLLKPLVQSIWGSLNKSTEKIKFDFFYGSLATYLENSYKRHLFFTSLVFKNEQKKLEDYYLPLTLHKHPEQIETLLDAYPEDLLNQYQRVLIVDNAGMGKSTISKYIFLTCMRSSKNIPILIELRRLSNKKRILDFIVEAAGNLEEDYQKDLILSLIKSGKFLFIFDGYDEINELDRAAITENIIEFVTSAPNNKYIMTSREESSLFSFPDFQRFTIRPLQTAEAYKLLRLYDQSGKSAEALISKLAEANNASIHEFLTNPMLTSLLFKSFEYKRTIPVRKHIFYRQVFDALFEDHDLMKEDYRRDKKSNLDIDQFDEFLRYFCFLTYKDGKFDYTKDELLNYINRTKQFSVHKDLVASNFLYDLTHGVPLMVEEGNTFRWVHRSMQEYFAAQWLCRDSKEKQKTHLLTMYKEPTLKHQNIIVLCADIDPMSFRKTILKVIIQNYISEFDSTYKDLDSSISEADIKIRKQLTIANLTFIAGLELSKMEHDDSDKTERFINKMIESLKKIKLTHQSATWDFYNGYAFGQINTSQAAMNNVLAHQKLLPFLNMREMRNEKFPPINSLGNNDFLLICDDPKSIVNRVDNFRNVNKLLYNNPAWSYFFDYEMASKMLLDITQEETESDALNI